MWAPVWRACVFGGGNGAWRACMARVVEVVCHEVLFAPYQEEDSPNYDFSLVLNVLVTKGTRRRLALAIVVM